MQTCCDTARLGLLARTETHTRCGFHDTIGLSSVTATGITLGLGTLVTTLYGQSALQVHVQHRPVADWLETKGLSKRSRHTAERDHLPQCGTRRRSSLAHPGDSRTGDIAFGNDSEPFGHPAWPVTKTTLVSTGRRARMIG